MKLIESDSHIIQVKLMNVEKNSLFVGDIFQTISSMNVNIDMISEVILEDEMRIDFTCSQDDQKNLDEALSLIRTKHPRIQIYQNRQVAKIKIESDAMKDEVGVAAAVYCFRKTSNSFASSHNIRSIYFLCYSIGMC